MEKIKYYIEKYKLIIGISLITLVLIITLLLILFNKNQHKTETIVSLDTLQSQNENVKEEVLEKIKVEVKGAVVTPGVYELNLGDRVVDAINKAGGLFEYSNTEYLNLSKKLVDEMIIIIYTNEEIQNLKRVDTKIIYLEKECICPDNINDACISKKDTINTNDEELRDIGNNDNITDNNNSNLKETTVSINNGSLEELMTLSGIGEAKAKAIIEYREKNGPFKSIEDIMNVSGIGESAYSKIKDNIKL